MNRILQTALALIATLTLSTPAVADVMGCGGDNDPLQLAPECWTCVEYTVSCVTDQGSEVASDCPADPTHSGEGSPCTSTGTSPGETGTCGYRAVHNGESQDCSADTEGQSGVSCSFVDTAGEQRAGVCGWDACPSDGSSQGDASNGEDSTSRSAPLIVFLAGLSILFAVRARSRE